ncbi:MAG: hypothetical protein ACLSVD_07235 [Eggerthellaceae bacterium]
MVVGDGHADAQLHERCRLRLAGDARSTVTTKSGRAMRTRAMEASVMP